jgi:hypothetical protein
VADQACDGRGPAVLAPARDRPTWWHELLLIVVTYALYTLTRNTLPDHERLARHHALDVLRLERRLHIDVERAVNGFVAQSGRHALAVAADNAYSLCHFGVTAGVLVWIYLTHGQSYRTVRTVLLLVTLAGLIGFWLYPLAPPRFLPELGYVDTVVRDGTWASWGSGTIAALSNQVAAMPSIHAAWSVWSAVVVIRYARSPVVKVVAAAYPVAVFLVILGTANHWTLDAAAGAAALGLAAAVQRGVGRVRAARVAAPTTPYQEPPAPARTREDPTRRVPGGAS